MSGGHLRAFLFAFGISVGIPLLLTALSIADPTFAMVYAYVLAPELFYAYPFTLFPLLAGIDVGATLFLLAILSGAFAVWMGRKRPGAQFLAALACFAAWWLIMRVLLGVVLGLHPHFQVHM